MKLLLPSLFSSSSAAKSIGLHILLNLPSSSYAFPSNFS